MKLVETPNIYFHEGGVSRRDLRGPDGDVLTLMRFALTRDEAWARIIAAGYVQPASYRTFACGICNGAGKSSFEADNGARGYETCSRCAGKQVYPTPQWMIQALALAADFARVQAFEEDVRGRSDCEVAWQTLHHPELRSADEAIKGPTYRREERVGQRQWVACWML